LKILYVYIAYFLKNKLQRKSSIVFFCKKIYKVSRTELKSIQNCGKMSDDMYPCGICGEECLNDTIQCSHCTKWTHSMCIPMEPDILKAWSDANMNFLCPDCCFEDGVFSQAKSLERSMFLYIYGYNYFVQNIIKYPWLFA